jgi:hypothetical protein
MQRMADPQSTATANLVRLSRWDWPSGEEVDLLRVIYQHFQIDPDAHEFLCRLCWLQHVVVQFHTTARFEPAFLDQWVHPMLATLTEA